jgi:hypothetical protein
VINFFAKSLVLVHAVFSVGALTYAIWLFVNGKDYGYAEPRKSAVEWSNENVPTKWVRYASEFDKSVAALNEAKAVRDRTFVFVKPALDAIETMEPQLPNNHLHYLSELKRLREAPDAIEIRRLKDGGLVVQPKSGRPEEDENALPGVVKSYKTYQADLKKVQDDIGNVDEEIRKKAIDIRRFTSELTGTDEQNQPTHPGLYKLIDAEFDAQSELRTEIDEIKPFWSKAREGARIYIQRREGLEMTLKKLQGAAPKIEKK